MALTTKPVQVITSAGARIGHDVPKPKAFWMGRSVHSPRKSSLLSLSFSVLQHILNPCQSDKNGTSRSGKSDQCNRFNKAHLLKKGRVDVGFRVATPIMKFTGLLRFLVTRNGFSCI